MMIKQFLRTFVVHFFLIYALTMLATLFYCLAQGTPTVDVDYFWKSALFSLAADAPLAVFISREELTRKQFWIRVAVHGVLLECLLMPIGHLIGMWGGVGGGFVFFFTVVAVTVTMYFLEFLKSKSESDKINKTIKNRRSESGETQKSDKKEIDNINE